MPFSTSVILVGLFPLVCFLPLFVLKKYLKMKEKEHAHYLLVSLSLVSMSAHTVTLVQGMWALCARGSPLEKIPAKPGFFK
jgi:hypothetical protein